MKAAEADASPVERGPVHLRLTIRTTPRLSFRVDGDRAGQIGWRFQTGRDAVAAVRAYCREQGCSAFVQILHPGSRPWREDWVAANGTIRSVYTGSQAAANGLSGPGP